MAAPGEANVAAPAGATGAPAPARLSRYLLAIGRCRLQNPTSQSLATLWAVGAVNVVATLVAVLCVVTLVYVRWFLPETKGKTLEEVLNMWADPAELHRAISTWR